MSTSLDLIMLPLAKRLLLAYGKTAVFKVPTTEPYDPATGAGTETVVVDYSRKITPPEPYLVGYVPENLIKRGDMKTYVASQDLGFTPASGWRLVLNSKTWRIEYVSNILSGEDIAMFELLLRG